MELNHNFYRKRYMLYQEELKEKKIYDKTGGSKMEPGESDSYPDDCLDFEFQEDED